MIGKVHVPDLAVGQSSVGAVHTLLVHRPYRQSLSCAHTALIAPRRATADEAL
jgi:hypothetical protein